jgi:hypothetical protein
MQREASNLSGSRSRPKRLLTLGAVLALAVFVAALGGISFQRKVESFRQLGFEARWQQGTLLVTEVGRPEAGLAVGERILAVNGTRPAGPGQVAEILRGAPESELIVERGGEIRAVTYHLPELDVDFPYLVLAAIGLVYLLIGLFTTFRNRQSPTGLFGLWCLASTAVFVLSPVQPLADGVDRLIYLTDQAARTLLPFLTLHLFLVFPTRLIERLDRALVVLYLPPAVLLSVHFDVFGRASEIQLRRLSDLEPYLLVLCLLLAALALIVRLARRPVWEQRRQVQLILFGVLGGSVPFLLLYLVPRTLSLAWPSWTALAAVVPMGLIPLTLAWAILKYQLLDLTLILRSTVTYGLTALVGLFGFALFRLAIQSGWADQLPVSRTMLTFAVGVAIAGALAPTKNAIASGIERLQYRASIGSRKMLGELGHELLRERDLDRLCSTLIDHLEDGMMVRANLYLSQGAAMVPFLPGAELPRGLALDAFDTGFWERDVAAIAAIGLPSDELAVEQRLFALGYRYALPLTVRDHRIGVVLMSYKYDEEPLNSEDLDIVRGLLNQAALAIENAQLLSEVHRRLVEVTELEEYNKGILESSPAGIAVLGADHTVVSANHAFAAIVGVPRAETRGRRLDELMPVRPLPEPEDGLWEVSFCEASGEERHLQVTVARYRRETGLRVLIVQDVSERVAMETALQEKEQLASLGMLAAGVAHEVNTPLTGISSYAQLLLADVEEGDPSYAILKKMERQTFRAAEIVNNLLSFARNRREELTTVNLGAVVSECVQLLEERAASAGVEVVLQAPAGAGLRVAGHEGELHQVFNNLVVNGIDALGSDKRPGRRIEVSLEAVAHRVLIRVSDNGPGIPPERLETIFRPFFSSKLSQGGSGLGLAISYNIVRRHGGEIQVENHTDGKGCTFTVELPRQL